jgi:hypothetical protein
MGRSFVPAGAPTFKLVRGGVNVLRMKKKHLTPLNDECLYSLRRWAEAINVVIMSLSGCWKIVGFWAAR